MVFKKGDRRSYPADAGRPYTGERLTEGPEELLEFRPATGGGVPAGGTTGQVLAKASGTDYDTEWVPGGGGEGGEVDTIVAGNHINVDDDDPANPEVSVDASSLAADAALTGAFAPVGAVAGAGGSGGAATHLWIGTETEYAAIDPKSATTVYVVVED